MKVVLFDIDKTLVKSFEIKGDVWKDLFRDVYGCKSDLGIEKVVSHGKTHKRLVFEALTSEGFEIKDIEAKWSLFKETFIEKYIPLLKSVEIFEDVDDVLNTLKERGFKLGLITGNLKEIAMAKLRLAGIDHYFSFGGFGDNLNRDDVAKEAIKDIIISDEIFFVGDTPLDVIAGKKVGAKAIGITTGIYSGEQLKSAGADVVINNIKQLEEYFE